MSTAIASAGICVLRQTSKHYSGTCHPLSFLVGDSQWCAARSVYSPTNRGYLLGVVMRRARQRRESIGQHLQLLANACTAQYILGNACKFSNVFPEEFHEPTACGHAELSAFHAPNVTDLRRPAAAACRARRWDLYANAWMG